MLYSRDIFKKAKRELKSDKTIIFTGARQTGKTSILIMLKNYLEEEGMSSFYFNLENPDYRERFSQHPYNLFDLLPKSKVKQYVIIDEIQYLNDPTNFLKLLYDEKRDLVKIVASGSSSFYIDKKFKDSLVGRKILFSVYPLNFNEFLIFKEQKDLIKQKKKKLSFYYADKLKESWQEYLTFGGYPEVVLTESEEAKKIILADIGSSYIKKDITDAGIRNDEKYFALLKILSDQSGELVNSQELANTLNIARKTVEDYLYVMQKSYHLALVRPFFRNARKELSKMPKVYFYDLGFRNLLLNDFSLIDFRKDKGAYLENIAFREFLNQTQDLNQINFWRTQEKKEVDFVVAGKEAYEVKFETKKVKLSKYNQFIESYPEINFEFLNYADALTKFYGWQI